MKRIIYQPALGETIPNPDAIQYTLPTSGFVVDVIVPKTFTPLNIVLYTSLSNKSLPEPFLHHFEGWEVE